MATKAEVKAFIDLTAPITVEICNSKNRKILPSVCIAQCCYESGYGTAQKMIHANALLGIKVGKSKNKFGTAWKGKAYSTRTKEFYDGTTATTITDMFRAYSNLKDSIEDYYDMLGSLSRYSDCIGETDPEKSITTIKNAGYATDPKYITNILSIIKTNNLTQYDKCMTETKKENIAAVDLDTNTKFKLGEQVQVTTYFSNSSHSGKRYDITKTGIIGKIKEGTRHPYCIMVNNVAIGWTETSYITSLDNSINTYKVKSGDNLSKIAKKYDTTVEDILEKNKTKYPKITANFIRVGWELIIK